MGKYIYAEFCKRFLLPFDFKGEPPSFNENKNTKILWDYTIKTYKNIPQNRPDMIYINKNEKNSHRYRLFKPMGCQCWKKAHRESVQVSLPSKRNKKALEIGKISIQPIVVGCLGTCSKQMANEIKTLKKQLKLNIHLCTLQKIVVEESVKMINSLPHLE